MSAEPIMAPKKKQVIFKDRFLKDLKINTCLYSLNFQRMLAQYLHIALPYSCDHPLWTLKERRMELSQAQGQKT